MILPPVVETVVCRGLLDAGELLQAVSRVISAQSTTGRKR